VKVSAANELGVTIPLHPGAGAAARIARRGAQDGKR
jgi:hypothetical protein